MASSKPHVLTHLRAAVLFALWFSGLALVDIALSCLLPFKYMAPDAVYHASSAISLTVLKWLQAIFGSLNGGVITLSGDPLPPGESAVVVSNHVAWTDIILTQAMAARSGMLSRCRYFAKIQLRAVPFLGWAIWAMGMPMVTRDWAKDRGQIDHVFAGIVNRRWPIWLIIFAEATRFTRQKYDKSRLWCTQRGRPQPKYTLYPRTKGFVTTVQHLRNAPQIKAVYDFTVAYQHDGKFLEAPTIWDAIRLSGLSQTYGYKFHVHARRFPIEDLPETDEELAKWLEKVWVEKGEWLDRMKADWST